MVGDHAGTSAPAGEEDAAEFGAWLIDKSFSMLARLCRIGLVVVLLMLLVVDPMLYRSGIWGANPQHGYLIAWHAAAALYFLGFLVLAGRARSAAARKRCLIAFITLGAALFTWFGFISWMLSGDLSVYAIYLLTMVCVFGFPGQLRKLLNIASTGTLIGLIHVFDDLDNFYISGAAINLLALAVVALLLDDFLLRLNRALYREKCRAEQERARADRVLYNAFPESIADELKNHHVVKAEKYQRMTVLFVDIVGFTRFSATRSPDLVVQVLNDVFSEFDALVDHHDVEKIKTIGDAYMVVGKGNPDAVAHLALDMQVAMRRYADSRGFELAIRAGIHIGPTVAGVIGLKRFVYDVWGDAVNTASRMESTGLAGRIQVSDEVQAGLRDRFLFEPRGNLDVKGKGTMATYFLLGQRPDPTQAPSAENIKTVLPTVGLAGV